MNLYQIASEYKSVINDLVDEETGEISETSLELLNQMSGDFNNKGLAIASLIQNIDAERSAIANAKKAMADRESRIANRVKALKSYLQTNMERSGITEISCAEFEIKLKKCPVSVDVLDEKLIPEEFLRVKTVTDVDKVKLKAALQSGVEIQGAALKNNMSLQIR